MIRKVRQDLLDDWRLGRRCPVCPVLLFLRSYHKLDQPTRIYLMDLMDGSLLGSLVFATHIVNALEEGEEVVFDLSTNPWDSLLNYISLEKMINHPETDEDCSEQVMKRVRLVKNTMEVRVEDLPNQSKVPVMNTFNFPIEKYSGYKNRFVYGWVGIDY